MKKSLLLLPLLTMMMSPQAFSFNIDDAVNSLQNLVKRHPKILGVSALAVVSTTFSSEVTSTGEAALSTTTGVIVGATLSASTTAAIDCYELTEGYSNFLNCAAEKTGENLVEYLDMAKEGEYTAKIFSEKASDVQNANKKKEKKVAGQKVLELNLRLASLDYLSKGQMSPLLAMAINQKAGVANNTLTEDGVILAVNDQDARQIATSFLSES